MTNLPQPRWTSGFQPLDRGLYALFSRNADRPRHERDRHRYRAAALGAPFDVYIARVYGIAWLVALGLAASTVAGIALAPAVLVADFVEFLAAGLPVVNRLPDVPLARIHVGIVVALLVGFVGKRLVVRAGGVYLRMRANARRDEIAQTLPGAVRYLRVLASGSNDQRDMLSRVAAQDAYGETARSFQRALNRATLTGSLDEGLSMVARETPSRELLSPFLLKFREHAAQGSDSLESYLKMESRLLSHRQERRHERASGYLELVAELFVVLLVVPALGVLIVTLASVLSPELSKPLDTPLGTTTLRAIIVYAAAAFVLVVGAAAAAIVASLRPTDRAAPSYRRPRGLRATVASASWNPASARYVAIPVGVLVAAILWGLDYGPIDVLLLAYAAVGVPVGLVAIRRARLDDAKDREIRDFVHAVSGHVSLGRPFPDAVDRVAREVDLGALQPDVEALAYNLQLTTAADGAADVRAVALDRFVGRVGTPLASQTIGLVVGALEAGSDTEDVFETLETEIGRLYHERKALRSRLVVYAAVGWTTALIVVGIVVVINATVLDGFSQLAAVSTPSTEMAIDTTAVDPARDQARFYLVTQATVLSCGWFAGVASRGVHEALLHSGALVIITYVVFRGLGVA